MKTGTATEQMVLNCETQCKLCLIAKTYQSYALKTSNQGVYHNKVWSCTEFARLLHKIRFFFLGQMNVLLWTPSKSTYIYVHTYLIGRLHFGRWALKYTHKYEWIREQLNNISWQPPFLGSPHLKGAPISKELNNISREFFLFFMEVSCFFKFFKLHRSILAKT